MSQTYEIKAQRVVINNASDRTELRRRVRKLERMLASSGPSIRESLDRLQSSVQVLDRDHERRDDLIVHVASSDGRPLDVVDRARPVDDRVDSFSQIHQTASPSGATAPTAPPLHTPPRVEAAAAPVSPAGAAAPRLFYQDRLVTLYHGDSLAAPELWLHADVLITDPPYGLQTLAGSYGSTTSANGSRTIANDLDTTVRDRVLELWGDKPAAVFGTPRLPEPPGGWTDRLVWDKAQLGLNGGAWRYAHESIFVRGDGWRRISNASSSILRHSSQSNRAHVNQHIHSKPEKLLADLIAAAPDGTIVDTFAGGGSTVAAAAALGRRIIAFELEEDHCQTIVDRLSARLDLGGLS